MPILVREDNLGLVRIVEKGMSKCVWCWTISKALVDLGRATGTRIKLLKVRRCSEDGDIMADLLSKGQVGKAEKVLPLREKQEKLPKALVDWLHEPVVTAGLGFKIAKELFMMGWQNGS